MAVTDIDVADKYDEKAIDEANHVPKFELIPQELLEITPAYHKTKVLLHSFSSDFEDVRMEEQQVLKRNTDWSKLEMMQDNTISTHNITSVDTCEDFVCFGTEAGGGGGSMDGRAFTIKPHNRQVTRTIFTGRKGNPRIMSAAKDGTVRMIDLARQSVSLQYCWDQSFSGKQGVNWLEQRGAYSYLLDCGEEINQVDIRVGEAFNLFTVPHSDPLPTTNLHVNKNLMSLCR